MSEPLHIDKDELFCNRCQKYVNKFSGTIVVDGQVLCIYCQNWICGEYDAFGDVEYQESPSIARIKMMNQDPLHRKIFLNKFLRLIHRKLDQDLPQEGREMDLLNKAWEILVAYGRHIQQAIS